MKNWWTKRTLWKLLTCNEHRFRWGQPISHFLLFFQIFLLFFNFDGEILFSRFFIFFTGSFLKVQKVEQCFDFYRRDIAFDYIESWLTNALSIRVFFWIRAYFKEKSLQQTHKYLRRNFCFSNYFFWEKIINILTFP